MCIAQLFQVIGATYSQAEEGQTKEEVWELFTG